MPAAANPTPGHVPVLLDAVLAAIEPHDDGVYIDATFGGGGYSEAILGAARCRVFGIDRDPDAVARGRALADKHGGRLTLIVGPFGDMERLIGPFSPGPIAGIAFDLGVSSMQLDEAQRGFSFRQDGPLDMRMSRDGESGPISRSMSPNGPAISVSRPPCFSTSARPRATASGSRSMPNTRQRAAPRMASL